MNDATSKTNGNASDTTSATSNTVKMPTTTFAMSTQDGMGVSHQTIVTLLGDNVSVEFAAGALTRGSGCRTAWQNGIKGTKKRAAKPIPPTLEMSWGDWVGKDRAAQVIVQQKPMTEAELFAEMLTNPERLARFQAQMRAAQASNPRK